MKTFMVDALERAIKTAAQTALASLGTTAMIGGVNWQMVGSVVLMATIMSLLTSIVSRPMGDGKTASLIKMK